MAIRTVSVAAVTQMIVELVREANYRLPDEVLAALRRGAAEERSPTGIRIFQSLLENAELARREKLPICQDTGMAVVFCEIGQDVHITGGGLNEAIQEGVRCGYLDGGLRLSVVSDPLLRVNSGDNTPAVIHTTLTDGHQIRLTVCPKGFGSENMSVLKLFNPTVSPEEVERFIADAVVAAGSNPCPPVLVGVGLGGTVDLAAIEAKRILCAPLDRLNPNPFYAEMEGRILERINRSGVGPMGLGGTRTALAVRICPLPTHIAGLPCVINISCHALRHAEGVL